jgi:flagellar basal-body rod modification protein FlgD
MSINSVDGISYYQPTSTAASTNSTTGNSSLTMDDFFTLLTAQLSNQDMSNPVNDSEFISQMAQFSMVQALSDLNKMSQTAYSVNLVGKEATVAAIDSAGELQSSTGIVEGVNLYNGKAEVVIDGTSYPISSVMEVRTPTINLATAPAVLEALQPDTSISGIDPLSTMDEPSTDESPSSPSVNAE